MANLVEGVPLRLADAVYRRIDWPRLARAAAGLHLLVLGLVVVTVWQDGAAAGGLSVLHLAVLIMTGVAAALLALRPGERTAPGAATEVGRKAAASEAGPGLVAQMGHELRTPLNAVIGFSEVMLRELYGPLGHARYQEYAACISESGERLLKASEDTLAVAASMSTLMADRRAMRRERVSVAALLQEAWAAAAEPDREAVLAIVGCGGEIECDGPATAQALEHLLREAAARTPPGGTLQVRGLWEGDGARLEIAARGSDWERGSDPSRITWNSASEREGEGSDPCCAARNLTPSVRVALARSLLEMQDAALSLRSDALGVWRACVEFPATGGRSRRVADGLGAAGRGRLQKAPAAACGAL